MKQARNELYIGLSVTLATLIVVVGILFLQQSTIFVQGLQVEMVVDNAQGIGKGSEVHFRGVRAGTVTGLELGREEVTLQLRLQEVTKIPADSRFSIGSQGLLGEKVVRIQPGTSSETLQNGATVRGTAGGGLADLPRQLSSQISGIEERLSSLLDNMNAMFGQETRQELHTLLTETREAAEEIELSFAENRRELTQTLASLQELTDESRKPLTATLEQLEAGTEDLDSAVARLRDVSVRLDLMLQKMDRGEGTMGSMLNDRQLYIRLTNSLEEIETLMKDIRENPDKYMTIKLF
jgi:phospholipid/cholesterol/gamma-HCH transport system substrate-binding protein